MSERPGGDSPVDAAAVEAPPAAPAQETPRAHAIVALGASAGGLRAYRAFLAALPERPGMSLVVAQHLAADRPSELPELLQNHTHLPVCRARHGEAPRPDHVYVLPPSQVLTLEGGRLCLRPRREADRVLDLLFESMAQDLGPDAVAVLMSGTGTDGTEGLRAIKERGGLTLAQSDDADCDGMPRHAVDQGVVDVFGTAYELAQWLVTWVLQDRRPPPPPAQLTALGARALQEVLTLVREHTGHDFSSYKTSTVLRRINRRLQAHHLPDITGYPEVLRRDPEEPGALKQDLLISVTSFFRDPRSWDVLGRDVLATIVGSKHPEEPVRVWVPGCATGQEAYSLAILLHEAAGRRHRPPPIQVFATDIDDAAIAFAREGLYPVDIEHELTPERLARFFEREPQGYRVKRDLRRSILFSNHNLVQDPPYSHLDLVSCRNLLIYLDRDVQGRVLGLFHYALHPGGWLFLGSSEGVASAQALFGTWSENHHLFRRRDAAQHVPRLAMRGGPDTRWRHRPTASERPSRDLFGRYQQWTLEQHAPPRMLIDDRQEITHLFGHAGRYLRDAEGPVSHNAVQRIHPELRLDLRAALHLAMEQGERTRSRPRNVDIDGANVLVQLEVAPLDWSRLPSPLDGGAQQEVRSNGGPAALAEVVFHEIDPSLLDLVRAAQPGDQDDEVARQLEAELLRTREQLQDTIERHEASSEEIKASNEELQSINEELRSTTEELETSKEELQSMNEELITVNEELKRKIDELSRTNADLQNLIAATQLATIFLDRGLRIKRYTPTAEELFHILPSDVGRPLTHVAHRLEYPDLHGDARQVLDALTEVTREISTRNLERWFEARLYPYRTLDDRIDGVVLTFVDISRAKRDQQTLARRAHKQQVIASLGQFALTGSSLEALLEEAVRGIADGLSVARCLALEHLPEEGALVVRAAHGLPADVVGRRLPDDERSHAGLTVRRGDVVRFGGDGAGAHDALPEVGDEPGMGMVVRGLSRPWGVVCVYGVPTRSQSDANFFRAVTHVVGESVERQRAHAQLQIQTRRFELALRNSTTTVFEHDRELRLRWIYNTRSGLPPEDQLGRTDDQIYAGADVQRMMALERQVLESGRGARDTFTLTVGDRPLHVDLSLEPLLADGELVGVLGAAADLTHQMHIERELRELNRTLEERVEQRAGQVRRLATALTLAEQRERHRIAQVLHDHVQQLLYAVQLRLRMLAERLDDAERAPVDEALGQALKAIRSLSVELSPPVLKDEGLKEALRWLVLQTKLVHGLKVELDAELPGVALQRDVSMLLFHFVRELLCNVVKHGEVDRARVSIRLVEGDLLEIGVDDQGAGFDPKAVTTHSGFGLYGIRERLSLFDGQLDVRSAPGAGTQVLMRVPLHRIRAD